MRQTLAPLVDVYSDLEAVRRRRRARVRPFAELGAAAGPVETPNSLLQIIATSAPFAAIQMFFAVLVIFFFLSGWTRMRKRTITARASFGGAMTTARVIQQVVDATSAYLGTITIVNIGMGLMVALVLYFIGMPTPLMWGGIVAVLNYIPYLGPIASALLLALGGLMTFEHPWYAMLPALSFIAIHLVEANFVTPLAVGRRLTINPLLILLSLSFWAWVWGTTGALLAVPMLIIIAHHPRRRRQARHCRLPVRGRHADPRASRRAARRLRGAVTPIRVQPRNKPAARLTGPAAPLPRRPAQAGVAQLVRAPACHAGGRGFEPRHSRQASRSWREAKGQFGSLI